MNCDEFEDRWNDVLDARSEGLPELELVLEAHSATCVRCQAISGRYQLLRQAVAAVGPPPSPSAATVARLRQSVTAPRPRRIVGPWVRVAIPLATAAALLAMAWSGTAWLGNRPIVKPAPTPVIVATPTTHPIETAFEEATSATIDLAREASAPAARIGRDVMSFESTEDSTADANLETDVASTSAATDMLQSVGDRVKPISGSARHAFSFLLGPAPGAGKTSTDVNQPSR